MKAVVTLSMLAFVAAGPTFAACEAPNQSIKVPSGASASRDEMLATQRAIKEYDAAVKTYSACLKSEQDAAIAAGGDKITADEKSKIEAKYAERQNAEVDKVTAVAAAFNVELKAFKAKNAQ
ncbi:MAG: hypothetical protein QM718_15555 [Steroidobacteraceae bacterium]